MGKPNFDSTWALPDLYLIIMLELCLSIIAACIPTLAPLVVKYIKPLLSKGGSGSPKPQPAPSSGLETIGSKPSRRTGQEFGGIDESLTKISSVTNTVDYSYDAMSSKGSEADLMYDRKW
jgi:hypothetical protein